MFNPHSQISLFSEEEQQVEIDIHSYDTAIVMMSGGKDSMACLLFLLEQGFSKSNIEIWHHEVDGKESSLMDWPVTPAYCKAVAEAFDIPIYFSWKEGGFEREMNRNNQPTAPTIFETPDGIRKVGGNSNRLGTRLMYPQTSASLTTRWCSSYLKISVADAAIRNQERFYNKRVLVITGERREESPARAKYKEFEVHRSDARRSKRLARHVDHYRPVIDWSEKDVWDIIEKYKVHAHPGYYLGFGRVSCLMCIFGSKHQWATIKHIAPDRFNLVSEYEKAFNVTIQRDRSIEESAELGEAYQDLDDYYVSISLSTVFSAPIFLDTWKLPKGAFGESTGPT